MLVRIAKNEDINSISGFQIAMAKETENIDLDLETVYKGVSAVLEDKNKGCYYLAEECGIITGSLLTTYEWSDWRNGTVIWIQSVYVLPEYRRRGVYSKLYSHVKQLVLENKELKGPKSIQEIGNEC